MHSRFALWHCEQIGRSSLHFSYNTRVSMHLQNCHRLHMDMSICATPIPSFVGMSGCEAKEG